MLNYVDTLAVAIGDYAPDCTQNLCWLYALLGLVKGTEVTLRDVHDAWAVWRTQTRPDHPDLVPFDMVPPKVQQLDEPYRLAIVRAVQRVSEWGT